MPHNEIPIRSLLLRRYTPLRTAQTIDYGPFVPKYFTASTFTFSYVHYDNISTFGDLHKAVNVGDCGKGGAARLRGAMRRIASSAAC
jgi:hypothetical protein